VLRRRGFPANQTPRVATTHEAFRGIKGRILYDVEVDLPLGHSWSQRDDVVRLLDEEVRTNERNLCTTRRVRADHGTRPNPEERFVLAANFVQGANLAEYALLNDGPPSLNLCDEATTLEQLVRRASRRNDVSELLRITQSRFFDDVRDRVQIGRVRVCSEAFRFERKRPASSERVQHSPVSMTDVVGKLGTQALRESVGVLHQVPIQYADQELVELRSLLRSSRSRKHRRDRGCSRCCKRSPRPPEMQSADVAVANRLLHGAVLADLPEREAVLDEAPVAHASFLACFGIETCRPSMWMDTRRVSSLSSAVAASFGASRRSC